MQLYTQTCEISILTIRFCMWQHNPFSRDQSMISQVTCTENTLMKFTTSINPPPLSLCSL